MSGDLGFRPCPFWSNPFWCRTILLCFRTRLLCLNPEEIERLRGRIQGRFTSPLRSSIPLCSIGKQPCVPLCACICVFLTSTSLVVGCLGRLFAWEQRTAVFESGFRGPGQGWFKAPVSPGFLRTKPHARVGCSPAKVETKKRLTGSRVNGNCVTQRTYSSTAPLSHCFLQLNSAGRS